MLAWNSCWTNSCVAVNVRKTDAYVNVMSSEVNINYAVNALKVALVYTDSKINSTDITF